MSHVKDTLTRPDGRNRTGAFIFYTRRPVSVVSSVTNPSDCFFFYDDWSRNWLCLGHPLDPVNERRPRSPSVGRGSKAPWRSPSFRKFAAYLRLRRYLRPRPQQTMKQPRNRPDQQQREPWTEPDGGRDDPQCPSWQVVHDAMSPLCIGRGSLRFERLMSC